MDSPQLELSNGISLVIFRYLLSYIPFLVVFCSIIGLVGKRLSREEENELLSLWGSFPAKEIGEKEDVVRVN
jgi:uncharacterized BrkB/YihY/UPF0761 family membrane protein